MADPKIKVGADMSAVDKELGKLEASAQKVVDTLSGSSVGIDVKQAKADLADLEQSAKSVADALSGVKGLGSAKGEDISKVAAKLAEAADAADSLEKVLAAVGQSTGFGQSVRASKQVADNLERAKKAQELLTQSGIKLSDSEIKAAKAKFDQWRASGARGTSKLKGMEFDEWLGGGYRKHSIDAQEADRNRRKILDALGIPAGGGGAASDAKSGWRGRFGGAAMGALGGIGMSALNGGDGFFSAMGGAGGTMLGAAAGMVAGGPIGAAVGAVAAKTLGAFGAVLDQSMQRVIADAETLTDLRHSIGKTGTDFEELRNDTRLLSANLRLTNNEASALARTFAQAYGQSTSALAVARGMQLGGGFSRSFGMDPAVGAMFFGSMQRLGASSDDRSSRRLALMIGEAVVSRGISPQMDAVLRAVQGYTEQTTRLSFTKANAAGYTDFMASMLGGSFAGSKDVGTVTSAMAAADAAMRQGGAFGEGSKAFSLGIYQRALPGFNAFDLDVMKDQGAFGTIANAFGKDSAAYKFAQARGDRATMARYARWAAKGGDQTVLSMQMKALEQHFGGNTDAFRKAIMGQFGVTAGQAEALYSAYKTPSGLGGLQKQLAAAGIDIGSINPKQIGDLAAVAGMGKAQLHAQAAKLLGDKSLNIDDKDRKALASGTLEEQRKAVLKITALNDTEKDQGEILDQQKKTIDRLTDDITTRLTPTIMDMKNLLISLLEAVSPSATVLDGPGSTKLDPKTFSKGQKKIQQMIMDEAKKQGLTPDETAFVLGEAWHESKFRNVAGKPVTHKVHGKVITERAMGPFQLMQSRIADEHINMDDMGIAYSVGALAKLARKHGFKGAAAGWQSGEGNIGPGGMPKVNYSDGNQHVTDYMRDVIDAGKAFKGLLATGQSIVPSVATDDGTHLRLPGNFHPSSYQPAGNPGVQQFQHTVILKDSYGRTIGDSSVQTHMGPPTPVGTIA